MALENFEQLSKHSGHQLNCSVLGSRVAILECVDCDITLLAFDAPDEVAPPKPVRLEVQVTNLLRSFGFPPNLTGYGYLRDAIIMAVHDHSYVQAMTTRLYPEIAVKYKTVGARVERAIRHAVEKAWATDNDTLLHEFADNLTRPTNSQFIAQIADRLMMERAG